jgi:lysophospholipase L1-like esterase
VTAVLCYGDSNTWGYTASTQERMGRWERWPGVLQRELGDDVHVIEEGLSGRTTAFDRPFDLDPNRNGLTYLPVSLDTHAPLEAVVISLGTNDLFLPGVNAYHVASGAMALVDVVRRSEAGPGGGAPRVLVVVPPPFADLGAWGLETPDAERQSRLFGDAFRAIEARERDEIGKVELLDLGEFVGSSPIDGIHFEVADHRAIGVAIAERLRRLLDLD